MSNSRNWALNNVRKRKPEPILAWKEDWFYVFRRMLLLPRRLRKKNLIGNSQLYDQICKPYRVGVLLSYVIELMVGNSINQSKLHIYSLDDGKIIVYPIIKHWHHMVHE